MVAISGPGRAEPLDDTGSFLLAGDETALPAIAQLLEWIEPDRSIEVIVETRGAAARIELPTHPGATVKGIDAVPGGAPGSAMADAVEALSHLPDAVWVAGEAATVQRLRKHLFDVRGLPRSRVTARGYWKLGRSAT